jgi:translation elongation factor EF-Ts
MKAANLQKSTMVPLEFETDAVTQSKVLKELSAMISSEVLDKHMGEHGSLCFVVRRPG